VLLAGSFGVVKSTASALGEEIGWRGFLVPELFKSTGFTGSVDHWRGVELLALSFIDLGRLQQRDADVVWPDVFHGYGNFHLFCVRLDEAKVWKPVERSDSSREPQSLRPRDFYSIDPRYR
jgi:hypothetical protein